MRKWLIRIAISLVVLGVGVVCLLAQLDVNQYKSEILDYIASQTGRTLSVNGDIGFKLALKPTLQVNGIAFGNTEWAAHESMVTADRVEVQLRVFPLLGGQLSVKKLNVVGARISLETDRRGAGNWLLDSENAGSASDTEAGLPQLDFQQISILRSTIEYRSQGSRAAHVVIEELHCAPNDYGQSLSVTARILAAGETIRVQGVVSALSRFFADEPYALSLDVDIPGVAIGVKGEIQSPTTGRGTHVELDVRAQELATIGELIGYDLPQRGPFNFYAVVNDTNKGYALNDATLETDASQMALQLSIEMRKKPLKITGRIGGSTFDVGDVLRAIVANETNSRVFSDQPLDLGWARTIELDVEAEIGKIVSPEAVFLDFNSALEISDGEISVDELSARVAEGTISADLSLDTSSNKSTLKLGARASSLILGKLPRFSSDGKISNGATDIVVELRGSGGSLAAIAGSADGKISWVTRNAVIEHGAANVIGGDLLVGLANQLNPLGQTDPATQLECFVIRFPITDGVAHNDTGIGARTTGLTMLGGGTIDLTTERIDLGIKPKPRTGVGLNLTPLAEFVRLGGTLQQPEIVTDAAGAATASLKVGAAVATVGLSVLTEAIFDRLTADTDACAVALGKVPISDSNSKPSVFKRTTDKTKNVLEDAGESVKGVFKRIFDK